MAKKIQVQIIGDASSLKKAFGQASGSSKSFGKSLGKVAKFGAFAAGAAGIGGLAVVLKTGIGEFAEASKVAAQTGAVLKSTGGVAKVTAKDVSELSAAMMRKTGIDDEAIASGQNILLTFTKIRNEVGKGNDIFNQATKATVDLSTAMKMDMQSASILVGKALNDPIKGMTALTRSGITFSEEQKKMVKGMIESGNVMGAQKLILAELNTQFGGSAEAMGKTLPGQIAILKQSFSNLSGSIVSLLVPAFTRILDWTTRHWPVIEATVKNAVGRFVGFMSTHMPTIQRVVGTVFGAVRDAVRALAAAFERNWPRIKAAGEAVLRWYKNHLEPTIVSVARNIARAWADATNKMNRDTNRNLGATTNAVGAYMRGIVAAMNSALAVLRGDWRTAWQQLKNVAIQSLRALFAIIDGFKGMVRQAAAAIGRALVDGIVSGVSGLASRFASAVSSQISSALSAVKGRFGIRSPSDVTASEIGKPLGQGVVAGWLLGAAALPEKMKESVRKAIEAGRAQIEASRGVLSSAWSSLSSDALSAFDGIAGKIQTRSEKLLAKLRADRDAAARAEAVSSAQSGLASAMAGTDGVVDPAAVASAQKALDDALFAQREHGLLQRAEQERRELDARLMLRRRHFESQLATLSQRLAKEGATAAQANAAVLKLLGKFGVNFKAVGASMGAAWAQGLRESIGAAARGAGRLQGSIAGAAAGVNAAASKGAARNARAGGGGGDVVLQVNEEVLGRVSRRHLDRVGMRNVTVAHG